MTFDTGLSGSTRVKSTAAPSDSGRRETANKNRGKRADRRIDATTVLSFYLAFTFVIPGGAVFAPLGSIGSPSTVIALVGLGWWVWEQFHRVRPRPQAKEPTRRVAIALILIMLIVHRHALLQPLPGDELSPSDSGMLRLLALVGIILIAADGVDSWDRLHVLINRLAIAAIAAAFLALIQFSTGQIWIDRLSIPGLSTSGSASSLLGRAGFNRPSGTSTHPIEFGAVLGMILPLAITRARLATDRVATKWIGVVIITLAVIISVSRTAIICSAVGLAFLLPTWDRRSRWKIVSGTVLLVLAASVAIPGLFGTLRGLFGQSSNDPSVLSRTAGYSYAQEIISYNPWLGRGYGTFLPKYYIFDNGYLGFLVEAGVVGTAATVTLFSTAILSVRSVARRATSLRSRLLSRALMAGGVAGTLAVAFFDLFGFPQSAASLALILGLSAAAHRVSHLDPEGVRDDSDAVIAPSLPSRKRRRPPS